MTFQERGAWSITRAIDWLFPSKMHILSYTEFEPRSAQCSYQAAYTVNWHLITLIVVS